MKTTLIVFSLLASVSHAAEIRMLTEMPTTNKTSVIEAVKSKKSAWKCNRVRLSETSGNAVNQKGSKPQWFTDVPSDQDDAAESLLAENKTAVKCVLQARIDGRMRNAESN